MCCQKYYKIEEYVLKTQMPPLQDKVNRRITPEQKKWKVKSEITGG